MAKIHVECEDKALSVALSLAIADALVAHGFENVRAKIEMVGVSPGRPNMAYPPELMGIEYMTAPDGGLAKDCIARQPELLKKPIVLKFSKTTSPKYELAEGKFLAKQ